MRYKVMSAVFVAALVGFTLVAFCQAAEPDATLALSGGSVSAGVGYSWGSGELTFNGRTYPLKLEGISVGTVGVARADASARVFNLKRLEDFDGTYTTVGVGGTVGGGGFAVVMRNQKGVELYLVGTTQGLDFKFALEGVKIALTK